MGAPINVKRIKKKKKKKSNFRGKKLSIWITVKRKLYFTKIIHNYDKLTGKIYLSNRKFIINTDYFYKIKSKFGTLLFFSKLKDHVLSWGGASININTLIMNT